MKKVMNNAESFDTNISCRALKLADVELSPETIIIILIDYFRLSKAVGDKLTNNNPNIADLSDKNRPTKLAEKYSELYDNQWTDAYEVIERYLGTEEDIIRVLLEILMVKTSNFAFLLKHVVKL